MFQYLKPKLYFRVSPIQYPWGWGQGPHLRPDLILGLKGFTEHKGYKEYGIYSAPKGDFWKMTRIEYLKFAMQFKEKPRRANFSIRTVEVKANDPIWNSGLIYNLQSGEPEYIKPKFRKGRVILRGREDIVLSAIHFLKQRHEMPKSYHYYYRLHGITTIGNFTAIRPTHIRSILFN